MVSFGASAKDGYAYADALDLVASSFETAFAPPARVSVADYAATHRWLANEGGGYVGRWSHAEVPYLVGPMDALASRQYHSVAVPGPGQSAKTSIAENWILQSVGCDPADFLWYLQTNDAAEAYVKGRINPMIETHPALSSRLIGDSLAFKNFGTMRAEFLPATRSALINKRAPRIVLDEVDAYPADLGDVFELANIRRQTFGDDSTILATSHPDRAGGLSDHRWTGGVMALYRDSDRRLWWWRCPHCGAYSSPNPTAVRYMAITWPEDAPEDVVEAEARLVCPVNGCLIEDAERRGMNLTGKWVGLGQDIDEDGAVTGEVAAKRIAGFWIVGAMSPFTFGGIGGLARSRVKAERAIEAEGDRGLREVFCKRWGVPYDPPASVGVVDVEAVAARADPALAAGVVPAWVRFLTAFVDVQSNRFELIVRGWGPGVESVVLAVWRIEADPATDPLAWDSMIALLSTLEMPLADASGRVMRLRAAGYDSGGAAGVTEQAYAAWRRARRARRTRMLGRISGREAWTLIACKGAAGLAAARLSIVYPDTSRRAAKVAARGEIPLAIFNPNVFKDALAGQLMRGEPGPGYLHFPAWLRGNFGAAEALRTLDGPHLWFEQLAAEERRRSGAWEKVKPRNEAIDLLVGSHVIAHLHGIGRMDWSRPAPYARGQDDGNPYVGFPRDQVADAVETIEPAAVKPWAPAAAVNVKPPSVNLAPAIVNPIAHNPAARRAARYA